MSFCGWGVIEFTISKLYPSGNAIFFYCFYGEKLVRLLYEQRTSWGNYAILFDESATFWYALCSVFYYKGVFFKMHVWIAVYNP